MLKAPISSNYKLLHDSTSISVGRCAYMRKWSFILQSPSPSHVGTNYGHPLPKFPDVWHRERQLIKSLCSGTELLKYYIVRIIPPSPLCWRCGKERGTHFDIFWQCEIIVPFWSMVMSLNQRLLHHSLLMDPLHCLMGLPFPGIGKSLNKLASFILLAGKRTIPLHYLSTMPLLRPNF